MKKIDPNRPVAYMGTIIVAILSIVQAEKRILPMAAGILLLALNFALTGVILLTIAQDTARRYSDSPGCFASKEDMIFSMFIIVCFKKVDSDKM